MQNYPWFNHNKKIPMKQILSYTLLLLCLTLPLPAHAADLTLNNTPAHVYFSPHGGATEAIVNELSKATTEILVQAYSFTSKLIARASC